MIEPYTAVGLIPSFWGIRRREDMAKNLEHIESLTHAAFWLSNLDIPVRLIAIPEGALQGFNDEFSMSIMPNSRAAARSTFRGPRPTGSGSWRATGTCLSWPRPRRATRTGPTASSTSGSSLIRTARSS